MSEDAPSAAAKYWAFVSYSSKDRLWGKWLIDALEKYRVPKSLIGLKTSYGVVPSRLYPVFRDRDELRVGSDVGAALHNALLQSRYLVVICSPNSADARSWVSKEIVSFKARGREQDVLALIVDGEPPACFPAPLRQRFDAGGHPTDQTADPLAADVRREDERPRASRRKALLKLIAAMIEVDFDTLEQRDRRRRRQRRTALSAVGLALLAVVSGLVGVGLGATRSALSQQLAKEARDHSNAQPDLALLLSVLAYRIAATPAAYESILTTIWPRQNLIGYIPTSAPASAVGFGPEDRWVAVANCTSSACGQSMITRYDLESLRSLGAPVTVPGTVTDLVYQPRADRLLIATLVEGASAVVPLARDAQAVAAPLFRSADPVTSIAVSDAGQYFAVGLRSGEFKVFGDSGRRCGGILPNPVTHMAFSVDGAKFAALGELDASSTDLADAARPTTRHPTRGEVSSLTFDSTGSELYEVFRDGTVRVWQLAGDSMPREFFVGPPSAGFFHVFDRRARYIASRYATDVRIYDLYKRREREREADEDRNAPPESRQQVTQDLEINRLRDVQPERMVFSPSGNLVATIDAQPNSADERSARGSVRVWSMNKRPIIERSTVDDAPAARSTEALSPDHRLRVEIGTGSTDECGTDAGQLCHRWTALRLTDVESALEIARLSGPRYGSFTSGPIAVAFDSDGSVEVQGESWRERWHIAPESLIPRACRIANRDLTSKEINDHLGWQKHIVRTLHPCQSEPATQG